MITLKNLIIGDKTSKVTIEHNSTEKSLDADCEIRALAILLGGYNEFGKTTVLSR